MNATARADAYRRQTGRLALTPAQTRRARHKTNRALRRAETPAAAPAAGEGTEAAAAG